MRTTAPELCHSQHSALVIVDCQVRLAAAMHGGDRARVLRNGAILLQAADMLAVPVLVTEQYPQGLGKTEADISKHIPANARRFEKTGFSCCAVDDFRAGLDGAARTQVILVGMEAHVCVLQTALELAQGGRQVFVVEDAVCSRNPTNAHNALARLRQSGVVVTNTESVVFEWLGDAANKHFKAVSALLK